MVKFSHLADCHLGGWRNQSLQDLNIEAFRRAIDISIKEKVDFVLVAGDLFDSAYPPIEILKETFHIFSKLKASKIPCYIIAGSHDYSVSGKTFLDVLQSAGFCINVHQQELRDGEDAIYLNPVIHENIALYGYPGRKSGLEVEDIRKIKLNESPLYKIFMLHTTLNCVKGSLPIDSVDESKLPYADYYALGHVHVDYQYENINYPGPLFPNNFQELADLGGGGFYIVDTKEKQKLTRFDIKIKDVEYIEIALQDGLAATDIVISEINKHNLNDKIVLLRLRGKLQKGKTSDINFQRIEEEIMKKNAYAYLKNNSDLKSEETTIEIETDKMEDVEAQIINIFIQDTPSSFNQKITQLISALSIEKKEDEKNAVFEKRLLDETNKVLAFNY